LGRKLNIKIGKKVDYYLYVGIRIPMDKLETDGERFVFNTGRERKEFRSLIEKERPKSIYQAKILYELYIM